MKHKTRLSGTIKKSRFSSVACRIKKWRAIGLGLLVGGGLFVTTIGYTQTSMLDGIRHAGYVIQQVKRKDEQARESLERYQRWVSDATAMLREQQAFINEVEMEKGLRKFNTQIPFGEETGYRYSTNSYGATYSVPNGSYRGDGLVGLKESWIPDFRGNPMIQDRTITQGRDGDRSIGNGWSFEPGGFLKEEYQTVNVIYYPGQTHCSVVLRYTYASANGGSNFQQRGNEQAISFDLKGTVGAYFCASAGAENFANSRPTQFWSDDGQIALDMSDPSQPTMRYPDGTFMKLVTLQAPGAYIPFNQGLYDFLGSGAAIGNLWFPSQSVSRNGQITNYSYDGNGWLQYITDFRGRVTQYFRDGSGRVQTITSPGPGGTLLSWHMTWKTVPGIRRMSFRIMKSNASLMPTRRLVHPVPSHTLL